MTTNDDVPVTNVDLRFSSRFMKVFREGQYIVKNGQLLRDVPPDEARRLMELYPGQFRPVPKKPVEESPS